jgi:Ca-activated chloride channel family protein
MAQGWELQIAALTAPPAARLYVFLTNVAPHSDIERARSAFSPYMKTKLLLALALLASSLASFADGLIIIYNPPPRIRPMPHPIFAPLEVVFHKVDVSIDGQKATTRVEQEFANPNDATLEGDYLFPIPFGAHIDKFTMRVGDKDLEAELLDANKARAIYEDIVRRQRDPALLEYTGRAAFRVRIFPIEPRSRKKVQLSYTELLKNDGGVVSYLYPLNTEKFSAQPLKTAAIKVQVASNSPIKALYSPSHSVEIKRDGDRKATVGWETTNARPDRDFQLLFSTAESEIGLNLVTQKLIGDDGWFLLLASPGADVLKTGDKPNPKDVVFVLDTSGSMAGKKLEQAKKALSFCVENLNETDRFEILRFATETEPCFEKLSETTRATRDQAQKWIDALKPIGGTAINEALQKALKLRPLTAERPFVVIFLTDGQPTVGETNEDKIVASVAPSGGSGDSAGAATRIFCFGIGTDVNTHLLDKIVERTRAASQFVLPEEDLEIKVSNFFTKIKEPLLTNVKVSWPEGVRVSKLYPGVMPDLFRGDQLVLAGRYSGVAEGDVTLEGTVNGQLRKISARVRFPESALGNEFIPQLWAMRRVGWLLDEIRLRGENKELRDEVVDLARRYAIVTPYTSYLIVEDEALRGVPVATRTLQQLDRNRDAQIYLKRSWDGLATEKAGDVGNFNARANKGLKDAYALEPSISQTQEEAKKAVAAAAPAPMGGVEGRRRELDELQQNARVVSGKAFYQNGSQWIDSDAQQQKAANRQRIQFASEEYFKLLRENPDASQWLALGKNVQFTLRDTLYEVVE